MWLVRRRLLVSRSVEAGGKRIAVRIFGSSGPSVVFEACRGEDFDSFVQIARQFSPNSPLPSERPASASRGPARSPSCSRRPSP